MHIKNLNVSLKAGPDDGLGEGQFTAYASVFGNVDSYGDVVAKGAFAATLDEYKANDIPIPLYYGHNMADPDFNLGTATAVEDDHGLLVTATLDLENPKSLQTYRLIKGRRINQMSFAFDVIDSGPVEVDGQKANELRALKLYEVSVVPIGANQETEILAVKSLTLGLLDGVKAGRTISAKNESDLKTARDLIDGVLATITATDDTEKANHPDSPPAGGTNTDEGTANAAGKAEEPEVVKAEDPTRHTSLDSLETIINYLAKGA